MRRLPVLLLAVLAVSSLRAQTKQDTTAADSALAGPPADSLAPFVDTLSLDIPVSFSDTIPPDLLRIVDNLGLNSHTARLISRFQSIPDQVVLEALARTDAQTGIQYINAFAVNEALNILCGQDSLWSAFFSDIERQLREPNLLRFNFRDNQKWKSYALNELFFSTFFQELLLVMGNIGIQGSRDGRQWLDGWPDPLRWKFREYRFEYMPEEMRVQVIESISKDSGTEQSSGVIRLTPLRPILPISPADSVEPPHF